MSEEAKELALGAAQVVAGSSIFLNDLYKAGGHDVMEEFIGLAGSGT